MTRLIFACGAVLALSLGTVGWLDARAETAAFLGLLGVAAAAYLTALSLVARRPPGSSRALAGCLLLGLVWRVVLITGAPLVSDDVYRYIWDGRVQRFGHDPYQSVPDDPELAHLHTESTARIDPASARLPTIYPPAAQLFFRAATTVHESVTMMVTAVVVTDLLTALVLWRWLVYQQRNPWWVLAYAWHPLVALEGAGGGAHRRRRHARRSGGGVRAVTPTLKRGSGRAGRVVQCQVSTAGLVPAPLETDQGSRRGARCGGRRPAVPAV